MTGKGCNLLIIVCLFHFEEAIGMCAVVSAVEAIIPI
jgi:hypothetical protein